MYSFKPASCYIHVSKLLLFFLIVCLRFDSFSQQTGVSNKVLLYSKVLQENRELLLYSPSNPATRLPLIIVFDGEALFETVVSTVKFMNYYSEIPQMPEAIIAGIVNTNRNRDMPIPQNYNQGSEDNFASFIYKELIPHLKNKFSLNGHIILTGHSQGGYFASYLLLKYPDAISWTIALDAPVNTDKSSESMKEKLAGLIRKMHEKRYASIETVYGWNTDWQKYMPAGEGRIRQISLKEETHESMAFKGIYEGMKFLFHDFAPRRKDLSLDTLEHFYKSVSDKYGGVYLVPYKILTSSAARKISENKKKAIIDLLDYTEKYYGSNKRVNDLREAAKKISKEPDTLVEYYLSLAKPTMEQARPYVGSWKGEFVSYRGQAFPAEINVVAENGKISVNRIMDGKKEEYTNYHISNDGKIIWISMNRGGGIIVTTAQLTTNGQLSGTRKWVGFAITDDMDEEEKKELAKILDYDGAFVLRKTADH